MVLVELYSTDFSNQARCWTAAWKQSVAAGNSISAIRKPTRLQMFLVSETRKQKPHSSSCGCLSGQNTERQWCSSWIPELWISNSTSTGRGIRISNLQPDWWCFEASLYKYYTCSTLTYLSWETFLYLADQKQLYSQYINETDYSKSTSGIWCFIAVLILSGYNYLPSKRMTSTCNLFELYHESVSDVDHSSLVNQ